MNYPKKINEWDVWYASVTDSRYIVYDNDQSVRRIKNGGVEITRDVMHQGDPQSIFRLTIETPSYEIITNPKCDFFEEEWAADGGMQYKGKEITHLITPGKEATIQIDGYFLQDFFNDPVKHLKPELEKYVNCTNSYAECFTKIYEDFFSNYPYNITAEYECDTSNNELKRDFMDFKRFLNGEQQVVHFG